MPAQFLWHLFCKLSLGKSVIMKQKKLFGKIILVDDEKFEKELLVMALEELDIHVDLLYFHNAEDALDYLDKTEENIFIIISDMNMPRMSGLEFKQAINSDKNLRKKAIPFIFSTSSVAKKYLDEAYENSLQGYFLKPADVKSMAKQIELIINYWVLSIRPDSHALGTQECVYKL